jgi:hypothetical protein
LNSPSQFAYERYKDDRIAIFHQDRMVMVLKGKDAIRFLTRVENVGAELRQLVMAKITGNFERGNERSSNQGK